MTTRLPSRPQVNPNIILPGPHAVPDDPEPLPDAMYQEPIFTEAMQTVRTWFRGRPAALISGDSSIYYLDADGQQQVVKPDCYVAFDVDAAAIRRRNGYFMRSVGKPPEFCLEIASPSTSGQDTGPKREIYAYLGVGEYWRFDGTGGEHYGEGLVGERLVAGKYQRIEVAEDGDGVARGYSPTLGMDICWDDGRLRFYDPLRGEYRRNLPEAEDLIAAQTIALRAAAAQLAEAQTRAAEAEAARQSAQTRAAAAEAEAQQLREQLQRLQPGQPNPE